MPKNTMTPKMAFSPTEAAQASSLSLRTVMSAIASGELPSMKVGRRRIVLAEDLESFLRGPARPTGDR